MTLSERLSELVRACFSGVWVQSFEHDEAILEIAGLCRQQGWSLATWDIDRGLCVAGGEDGSNAAVNAPDPLAAIKAIGMLATQDGTAVLVLRNFHRFLGSVEVVQALDSAIAAGKQSRTILVVLSPVVQIPTELERAVRDRWSTTSPVAINWRPSPAASPPSPATCPRGWIWGVLDSAVGLTRIEAENAFSLSLIRHGRVTPEVPDAGRRGRAPTSPSTNIQGEMDLDYDTHLLFCRYCALVLVTGFALMLLGHGLQPLIASVLTVLVLAALVGRFRRM